MLFCEQFVVWTGIGEKPPTYQDIIQHINVVLYSRDHHPTCSPEWMKLILLPLVLTYLQCNTRKLNNIAVW